MTEATPTLSTAQLAQLPLFPLPGAFLLPRMHMPLHIFEERYRQLVQDAKRERLPIAIACIDEGTPPSSSAGPAVRPVAGVGLLEDVRELPDGRFLIELVGVQRVRIVKELDSDRLYRLVRACPAPELIAARETGQREVEALRRLAFGVQTVMPRASARLLDAIADGTTAGEVADSVAALLDGSPEFCRAHLECEDPLKRLDQVLAEVSLLLGAALREVHGAPN